MVCGALAIWFVVPTIILLPISFHRWRSIKSGGLGLQITALLSGLTLFLYTLAFLYTDVMRAMLLFYLTPIWSTLIAAFVLGERITLPRVIAILLAILGMLIIFGLGLSQCPTTLAIGWDSAQDHLGCYSRSYSQI